MIGYALLLTVFLGGVFATPQEHDLYGQAGRAGLLLRASASTAGGAGSATAAPTPVRQRSSRAGPPGGERLVLLLAAVVGTAAAYPVLKALGSWGPLPDAWIFVGSLLATYGRARGWVEFWLLWIAVDAVGVPLLLLGGFYPSAVMYLIYGALCAWGFVAWLAHLARRGPRSYAHLPGGRA